MFRRTLVVLRGTSESLLEVKQMMANGNDRTHERIKCNLVAKKACSCHEGALCSECQQSSPETTGALRTEALPACCAEVVTGLRRTCNRIGGMITIGRLRRPLCTYTLSDTRESESLKFKWQMRQLERILASKVSRVCV